MEKIETIISSAVPLTTENVDTDQIIPARFLRSTDRNGFGRHLFADQRYNEDGNKKSDFVLNDPRFGGSILVAGNNFGCGSSREHAAWALHDHGFRVIVSSFFADIFTINALNNGLLPLRVSEDYLEKIFRWIQAYPAALLKVDLNQQYIEIMDIRAREYFDILPYKKECLLKGLNDLDLLLSMRNEVELYEKKSNYLQLVR